MTGFNSDELVRITELASIVSGSEWEDPNDLEFLCEVVLTDHIEQAESNIKNMFLLNEDLFDEYHKKLFNFCLKKYGYRNKIFRI